MKKSIIYPPSPSLFYFLTVLRSRGSGGMIVDPLRSGYPRSGFDPSSGIPDILPPGAVPPGARFDPFGPVGRRRPGWVTHKHTHIFSLCPLKGRFTLEDKIHRPPVWKCSLKFAEANVKLRQTELDKLSGFLFKVMVILVHACDNNLFSVAVCWIFSI